MKKILLFACIEKNVGDDIFIKTICERYPDCLFIISKTAEYGTLKKINNLKFSRSFYYWQRINERYRESSIKRFILKPLDIVFTLLLKRYNYAVYIVGNAFKNIDYKGIEDSYWLNKRVQLVSRFYLISTNFGPFDNIQWKIDCENIFKKMRDICFRDLYSYNFFQTLPNVRYAPDAVLSTKKHLNTISTKRGKSIVISVIDFQHFSKINSLGKYSNAYEKKIIEIIQHFSKKDFQINIVNFNSVQDKEASKRIVSSCKYSNISIIDYDGNLNEIYDLYMNTDYVIGTRLHSIILAWIYNKPVFPIIYDIKVKEMLKAYQFNQLKIDLENISTITPMQIESSLNNYIFENKQNLFNDANEQFKVLDRDLL